MQDARLTVLREVTRLGEVQAEEAKEEVVVEKVKDSGEVKVVEDRRRLLVAPRVKRKVTQ